MVTARNNSATVSYDPWLDAQIGVLGSVLIDPELAPRLLTDTQAEDYTGDCRAVYGAICAMVMAGEQVDAMTVRNRLGAASAELLRQIIAVTPTSANYPAYAEACREQRRLSELHGLAGELEAAATLDQARALLGKMQGVTVEHNAHRVIPLTDALVEFTERSKDDRKYIDWGLPALDDRVYTAAGDVVVLGGYPSDGKSAFMLQAALHMARQHKVGVFSFEGTHQKTADRLAAHGAQLPLSKIRRGELNETEWAAYLRSAGELSKRKLEIIEASGMTVGDVIGMTLSRGYEVIFLDYIQLIQPSAQRRGGTRQDELAEISRALAVASRQHKLLVVELSQLNRPEKRGKDGATPHPTMQSLRDSGQLEQDADAVLLLYRIQQGQENSPRELFVAKNKEGRLGKISLNFDGQTQTFSRTVYQEISRLAKKSKREMEGQRGLDDPDEDNPFGGDGP